MIRRMLLALSAAVLLVAAVPGVAGAASESPVCMLYKTIGWSGCEF